MLFSKSPMRVSIHDVAVRDGFQSEPVFVPTEDKIKLIDRLSQTGLAKIEVTSFVSPKAIPNLRAVSISGWANFAFMGEKLGKDYVYSRKPTPALISGSNPDWNLVEADVFKTHDGAKNSHLEFLFRDIYTINHDWPRLRKWVDLVKATFGM